MMQVSGDAAKRYEVIDLSSFKSLSGTVIEADDQLGTAVMADRTGETKKYEFGPRRIKLLRKRFS